MPDTEAHRSLPNEDRQLLTPLRREAFAVIKSLNTRRAAKYHGSSGQRTGERSPAHFVDPCYECQAPGLEFVLKSVETLGPSRLTVRSSGSRLRSSARIAHSDPVVACELAQHEFEPRRIRRRPHKRRANRINREP